VSREACERPSLITPALIASLHPVLVQKATRMVGQREAAEDVVQETWISALRSVDAYQGRSTLTTWLVAIMRRRVCDLRRQTRRRLQPLDEDDWVGEARVPEVLDARTLVEAISQRADRLTEPQRAAIVLCGVEGHDRDRAAAMLNVSRAHLRVLLHRGRAHLRAATAPAAPRQLRTGSR
jgi:RNA polymerase sigma-70 factor (ECF subfamily)